MNLIFSCHAVDNKYGLPSKCKHLAEESISCSETWNSYNVRTNTNKLTHKDGSKEPSLLRGSRIFKKFCIATKLLGMQ